MLVSQFDALFGISNSIFLIIWCVGWLCLDRTDIKAGIWCGHRCPSRFGRGKANSGHWRRRYRKLSFPFSKNWMTYEYANWVLLFWNRNNGWLRSDGSRPCTRHPSMASRTWFRWAICMKLESYAISLFATMTTWSTSVLLHQILVTLYHTSNHTIWLIQFKNEQN